MFILNGQPLREDVPFTHNGIQYPANWLRLSTFEEKIAIGITEVVQEPRPDDTIYWVTDNNDGTYTATPKDLDTLKDIWRQKLKARRDKSQFGGMLFNGIALQTDIDSQTKYVGAAVAAMLDNQYLVTWKTADGNFVELTAAQIIGVSQAVRAHVQATYDNEAAISEYITAAGDLNTLQQIDLELGWPTYA